MFSVRVEISTYETLIMKYNISEIDLFETLCTECGMRSVIISNCAVYYNIHRYKINCLVGTDY